MDQMVDNWWKIIEISIIALAFTANVLNQCEFCIWLYIKHNFIYEVWIYDENDEILRNAIAFTANEPIYWENSGNFCVWPYIRHNICMKHGQRGILWWRWWNFDNGQSICQYFSNLCGIFGNFVDVLTFSSQYWYCVMPLSKFPKLLCI